MPTYVPNAPAPYPGDETPNLDAILKEVKGGCANHEATLRNARELQDWYDGDSEKFIPFKPAEDALSWLTRPKRVSFITRQAVNKLTSHLYKPGPRHRTIANDDAVSAWYGRVSQDIDLSALMQQADRLATLHGLCAVGVYPTGCRARPINYHLFPRQDFAFWVNQDDPRVATAACTITNSGPDLTRFRVWTSTHYYTFYKSKTWGYQPGGWGAARFDPASSGPHPYGVLPFCFITHELPTTELETRGLGHLLAKINRALNADKSNLALWVHHYARPLGFISGVGPEWRPRFIDGGFVPLVVRHDSTESAPVIPQANYLESSFDIAAVSEYIRGEANLALAELGVPLTLATRAEGGGGAGNAMSGLAIAALDADLITYARGRQPLFAGHETRLAALICKVAASAPGDQGDFAADLDRVADDPSLRIGWPEVQIDLPGEHRDRADEWELAHHLTDPIEVLMHRRGLTEREAIEQYRATTRRRGIAQKLDDDPEAAIDVPPADRDEPEASGAALGPIVGDMGVPAAAVAPNHDHGHDHAPGIVPTVTTAIAYRPDAPMPAVASPYPGPGGGFIGTES